MSVGEKLEQSYLVFPYAYLSNCEWQKLLKEWLRTSKCLS